MWCFFFSSFAHGRWNRFMSTRSGTNPNSSSIMSLGFFFSLLYINSMLFVHKLYYGGLFPAAGLRDVYISNVLLQYNWYPCAVVGKAIVTAEKKHRYHYKKNCKVLLIRVRIPISYTLFSFALVFYSYCYFDDCVCIIVWLC